MSYVEIINSFKPIGPKKYFDYKNSETNHR